MIYPIALRMQKLIQQSFGSSESNKVKQISTSRSQMQDQCQINVSEQRNLAKLPSADDHNDGHCPLIKTLDMALHILDDYEILLYDYAILYDQLAT